MSSSVPAACTASVTMSTRRRSQRSTKTPAKLPPTIIGTAAKKDVRSSGVVLPVSSKTRMPTATWLIALPISDSTWVMVRI
jgi:hypothetical protein